MPTSFKADTIQINNIESTGSVGPAGNRWAVVKVSASLHLLNTSSIRFNDSTEVSSSKAGVLNFYAVDTYFSSSVKILNLTGAIHNLPSGISYLAAGSGVTITSGANSQVTIAATSTTTTFDNQVPYVTLNATSSLTSERVLTASNGIVLADGGAGGAVTLSADGTVARISGSRFVGNITVTGTGSFETSLTVGSTTAATVFFNTGTLPANTKIGIDVLTFISGVVNSQGTTTQGTSLFTGDVACSGTFIYPSASYGYITIPAAGLFNAGSGQFTVGTLASANSASNYSNPSTQQATIMAPIVGLPPGCTIDQIQFHLSKSSTQVSQHALFSFSPSDATSNLHTHIASTSPTTKGERVIITLDNLSHSVAAETTDTQLSYYVVNLLGIGGQTPTNRIYSVRVRYIYNKLRL